MPGLVLVLFLGWHAVFRVVLIVLVFCFDWRRFTGFGVDPFVVVPVNPTCGGVFDVGGVFEWPGAERGVWPEGFGLVEADQALSGSVDAPMFVK